MMEHHKILIEVGKTFVMFLLGVELLIGYVMGASRFGSLEMPLAASMLLIAILPAMLISMGLGAGPYGELFVPQLMIVSVVIGIPVQRYREELSMCISARILRYLRFFMLMCALVTISAMMVLRGNAGL